MVLGFNEWLVTKQRKNVEESIFGPTRPFCTYRIEVGDQLYKKHTHSLSPEHINKYRGGLIIQNGNFFDIFRNRGGGLKTKQKCLKFKFGHLKTHGWGVSIFQKCLNYKLLSDPILKKKN